MDDIVLSICIPIYNQIDLVKECILHILESKSNKYEIVVSDDGSQEPIEDMVNQLNDYRIVYYRNEKNLGHDRNILSAFSRARAKYAFLLRTRDFILPDGLEKIISYLENNDDISYLTTSAYDGNMIPKIIYNDCIYPKGKVALQKHNNLYVHPSGSVYNISLLDIHEIDDFLVEQQASKYNFTVHSLIRLLLALKGDFVTCSFYSWIYPNTSDAKDVAVNKSTEKLSVYDTKYETERYKTEMLWADKILPDKYKINQFLVLLSRYLYATTWNNKLIYKDRNLRRHYGCSYRRVNCRVERVIFLDFAEAVEEKLLINDTQYYNQKRKVILRNKYIDNVKYCLCRLKALFPAKKNLKQIFYDGKTCLRKAK